MPCIFDKNKCLKHRNLQKVEKSLNICRCIRFLCIYMVYPKKNVACAKKETNHYYVHLYYRVKESFRNSGRLFLVPYTKDFGRITQF